MKLSKVPSHYRSTIPDRIKSLLSTIPDDEVYSTTQVANKISADRQRVQKYVSNFKDHVLVAKHATLWGTKKAIACIKGK